MAKSTRASFVSIDLSLSLDIFALLGQIQRDVCIIDLITDRYHNLLKGGEEPQDLTFHKLLLRNKIELSFT